MRKRRFYLAGMGLLAFAGASVLAVFGALFTLGVFDEPDFSRLDDKRETSVIYDETGERLREYCTYCRETIMLEEAGHFVKIAVAVEDKNFWERTTPVDWKAVIRAAVNNFRSGKRRQGASTISQQVAGNIWEEEVRTGARGSWTLYLEKLRKIYLAKRLEDQLDKKQILELYLNTVFCGHGHFGVKACSNYYFGRNPSELNIAEAAMIAGTWRSPRSSPFLNPQDALRLRSRVLGQLVRQEIITEEEEIILADRPLPGKNALNKCDALHAVEYVRRQIVEGRRLVDAGLEVRVTINCAWQKVASDALRRKIQEMRALDPDLTDLRGVALLVSVHSGGIKAFAQEPGFAANKYLIDQIKRHAGSAMKPFFYASFLERGGRLSCEDEGYSRNADGNMVRDDGSCRLDDSYGSPNGASILYLPLGTGRGAKYIQNFPYENRERYLGVIDAMRALEESRNAATMSGVQGVQNSRVPQLVSKEDILELAYRLKIGLPTADQGLAAERGLAFVRPPFALRLGIPINTLDPGQTVAIGSMDVSPLELLRAFTGLAGGLVEPYIVEEVRSRGDAAVEVRAFRPPQRILDERTALAVIRGLRATVERPYGTAKAAKRELPNQQFMGKTGTATNQAGETTDNWFVGCSPSYCMVVWIGREKQTRMRTVEIENPDGSKQRIQPTGGRNALPVVLEVMKEIYRTQPTERFDPRTDPFMPFRMDGIPHENEEAALPASDQQNDF